MMDQEYAQRYFLRGVLYLAFGVIIRRAGKQLHKYSIHLPNVSIVAGVPKFVVNYAIQLMSMVINLSAKIVLCAGNVPKYAR